MMITLLACQLRFVNRFKRIFLFESYSLHFSLFYTEASSEYGEQYRQGHIKKDALLHSIEKYVGL